MATPISLVDARLQLRLEADDQSRDVDLGGYIEDAAAWVEDYTGHILVAREVTEQFCGSALIQLRAWPVTIDAVAKVTYTNRAGVSVAIAGLPINSSRRPAQFSPRGSILPFCDTRYVYTVTVTAGYTNPDDVPRNFKRAMLILISAYDADREGGELFQTAEATARKLCGGRRLRRV